MGWHCMHIKNSRFASVTDKIFRSMLRDEQGNHGFPDDAKVYYTPATDGGHCYYFSPAAAVRYALFLKFWAGYACFSPLHLERMDLVMCE
jgi:hypothetical protein